MTLDGWLTDALLHAGKVRRENAHRAVSSYAGGYDAGWADALEKVRVVFSTEGSRMDILKWLKVAGQVMADLPQLEAMAAGLAAGKLPTPAEIALLMKLIAAVKAAV